MSPSAATHSPPWTDARIKWSSHAIPVPGPADGTAVERVFTHFYSLLFAPNRSVFPGQAIVGKVQPMLEQPVGLLDLAQTDNDLIARLLGEALLLLEQDRTTARHRIERACHLLETTELSVERIAHEAGFGTAASLRQHLNASVGAAPSAYRRTFRSA